MMEMDDTTRLGMVLIDRLEWRDAVGEGDFDTCFVADTRVWF